MAKFTRYNNPNKRRVKKNNHFAPLYTEADYYVGPPIKPPADPAKFAEAERIAREHNKAYKQK